MSSKTPPKIILVLGGYGTFGARIVQALAAKEHRLLINGRNEKKATKLARKIIDKQPNALVSPACFDVFRDLKQSLLSHKPDLVIHCCGPFQGQDTHTAQTVIESGIHYIDLSDGRDFVQSMLKLDSLAKTNQVVAITAASTVPTLSSAVLYFLQERFSITQFKQVKMGISPGQKTNRGLATTQAVLSYIGKPLKPWPGNNEIKYGWQNTYLQPYPGIKNRLMGNCEAADLDLLHLHFPIHQLTFSAGMESKILHFLVWACSWLVRLKLPIKPAKHASWLLSMSRWFDMFGSEDGGMHIGIDAKDNQGNNVCKTWYIIAKTNDGPQIPAIPAIILAEKILNQEMDFGCRSSINTITLSEYINALDGFAIETQIL